MQGKQKEKKMLATQKLQALGIEQGWNINKLTSKLSDNPSLKADSAS